MTLAELKSCIDQAVKKAGKTAKTANVEVWYGDEMLEITEVSQFGVVPDVMLTVAKEGAKKAKA